MLFDYAKTLAITDDESVKWTDRIQRVNNKLSEKYYSDKTEATLIVGSVGRLTAITKTSDYDVLYVLPSEVYTRFNNHSGNGQSALLQEVKEIIRETYPNTTVKGDGQVVDIIFTDGTIELVPAFEKSDGSFDYPDSNDGGKWKNTKPVEEIYTAVSAKDSTDSVYNYLCYLLRKWKNYTGFAFKGLLIDTFVLEFLNENSDYTDKSELDLLKLLYKYLSSQDKERSYWLALGSNQQISNDDKGKFIKKASKALSMLDEETDIASIMKNLFGYSQTTNKAPQEEFAENKFSSVDVIYNLTLDCDVTQEGWRTLPLSEYLAKKLKIKGGKTLNFRIVSSNIPSELPVTYYWKVRNLGPESVGRERGKILRGSKSQTEHSSFNGKHYVECFAVVENVVIARSRVNVPIDLTHGI